MFNTGIAFLTVPIFTRILNTNDYGIINTYASWVGVTSLILGLALHMAVRSAFVDFEEQIEDFMSSISLLSIFSTIISAGIIFLVIKFIEIDIQVHLVLLCILHGFSSSIISNYSMFLMMKFKYKTRTWLLILPNLIGNLFSIFIIIFVLESNKYLGKIVPTALTSFVIAIIIIIYTLSKSKEKCNISFWSYALKVSVPIIFHGLSLTILSQSDRIMITALYNASETGIYSVVYNISMIATVIGGSLEGVWVPWFTTNLKEKRLDLINDRVVNYIEVMTFVIIGILLISPEVINIMAPKEYWIGKSIIPPFVLSSFTIFLYTLYVNVEHFYKKTRWIAMNTAIAAATNILLNLIFIPRYGMYAAAITTLVSYILSLFMHYRYARKINSALFDISLFIKPVISLIISIIAYYILIENFLIRWSLLLVFVVYIYKTKRSEIIKLLQIKD